MNPEFSSQPPCLGNGLLQLLDTVVAGLVGLGFYNTLGGVVEGIEVRADGWPNGIVLAKPWRHFEAQ